MLALSCVVRMGYQVASIDVDSIIPDLHCSDVVSE
jgi:hypothetical protein